MFCGALKEITNAIEKRFEVSKAQAQRLVRTESAYFTAIGKNGELTEVENLPNSKIVDNQYAKMVDQKTNYLLGKPFNIKTENKTYETALLSPVIWFIRVCEVFQLRISLSKIRFVIIKTPNQKKMFYPPPNLQGRTSSHLRDD